MASNLVCEEILVGKTRSGKLLHIVKTASIATIGIDVPTSTSYCDKLVRWLENQLVLVDLGPEPSRHLPGGVIYYGRILELSVGDNRVCDTCYHKYKEKKRADIVQVQFRPAPRQELPLRRPSLANPLAFP